MAGSRFEIERQELLDDFHDEDTFPDDFEGDFYDLDLYERGDLLLRCNASFSSVDEADGDGDRSIEDDISTGSGFPTSRGARTAC